MLGNWRTTAIGVLTILTVLGGAAIKLIGGEEVDWGPVVGAVMAAVGLITARDAD